MDCARRCAADLAHQFRDTRNGDGSGRGGYSGERETHSSACLALERAVYGARMMDEVAACPRIAHEELNGKHVCLESIARWACGDDVAGCVGSALGQGLDVVQRRVLIVEWRCAVHTAPAAVAQGGELDRTLLLGREEPPDVAHDAPGCT